MRPKVRFLHVRFTATVHKIVGEEIIFSEMNMFEFRLKFHKNLFNWVQLGQVMAGRRIGNKSLA